MSTYDELSREELIWKLEVVEGLLNRVYEEVWQQKEAYLSGARVIQGSVKSLLKYTLAVEKIGE